MEEGNVLDLVFELHKHAVLKVLSLQECLPVNWTIKQALEAQIPHDVLNILLGEEILVEVLGEVTQDALELFEWN